MKLRLVSAQKSETVPVDGTSRRTGTLDPLADLLPLVLRGDITAERTLLTSVGPSVLAIVRRVIGASHPDVEDVCQESYLALLNALPSFRGQCSVLHFACRVALFTALAKRRRRRYVANYEVDPSQPDDSFDDGKPDPAELLEQHRIRVALRELLDELPMQQSEVLALHVVLGHTIEELSLVTECNANTIRSRLRRGLDALRQALSARSDLLRLLRGDHD